MATPNNQIRRRGSFAPLSAQYYYDDAIAQAGEAAELLYVRGLAFSAATLRDGLITDAQLGRGPGVGMVDAPERAARLVEVGLWVRVDGGYAVRTWLNWNNSAEEIAEAAAKDRERKRRGGRPAPPEPPAPPDPDSARNPNGLRPPANGIPGGVRNIHTEVQTEVQTQTACASDAGASDRVRDAEPLSPEPPHDDDGPEHNEPLTARPRGRPRRGGAAGVAARYGRAHTARADGIVRAAATANGIGAQLPRSEFTALCARVDETVAENQSANYTDDQLTGAVRALLDKGLNAALFGSVLRETLARRPALRAVQSRSSIAVESVRAARIEYDRRQAERLAAGGA